ncbi:MAG: hypothetical protein ACI9E1_000011 [Cryomorphaceae bacterium]|jgi:hypothetical protein
MNNKTIIEAVRISGQFKTLCETFKNRTDLDLWLDSKDSDDPRSNEEMSNDYYTILTKDLDMEEECEVSHQSMRDASHGKQIKYAEDISGLIHFLVPIHSGDEEIGFLRCGGIKDAYRGVKKLIDFTNELHQKNADGAKIVALEAAYKQIPNLYGEDLAEAVNWLADQAVEIEKLVSNLKKF